MTGYIWLEYVECIEREFLELFNKMLWEEDENWKAPKFDSQIDLSLMKEIDNAERCSLLVVKSE